MFPCTVQPQIHFANTLSERSLFNTDSVNTRLPPLTPAVLFFFMSTFRVSTASLKRTSARAKGIEQSHQSVTSFRKPHRNPNQFLHLLGQHSVATVFFPALQFSRFEPIHQLLLSSAGLPACFTRLFVVFISAC